MSTLRKTGRPATYDAVLSVVSGASIGWFAWWFGGAYVTPGGSGRGAGPLWVFEVLGIAVVFSVLRWVRGRERAPERRPTRWVHLLWAPAILLTLLMIQVVLALRSWR